MQPLLETLPNGAIIFDRFDCEVEGKSAEVVFAFTPGNAMTPFVVWHRAKNNGTLFWGQFFPGVENDRALAHFKERKTFYAGQTMSQRREAPVVPMQKPAQVAAQ